MAMKKKAKSKKISTDDLAILINNGFERVETRIGNVETEVGSLEKRLTSKINGVEDRLALKITGLENRIDDLALNRVKYTDFNPLKKDVEVLKKKFESEHPHGR